ncbi:MAG: hypothetical protein PVH61_03080 [Candidatus Aminicenantes bacterium]|jgi:hypothetical protein
MTDINWSKIGNGATFESLSSVIVRHEDFKARVYDRPGKDAAMDIKSGDGSIVYQAKYIGDQRFDTAIKESLKELDKIKKYKKENHPNYEFWVDVKKWCLITNARLNPTDEKKWQEQVVEKFKAEGFEDVELWHHATLIEKIIKLPHVKQEYFEGENRVIISLAEAYEAIENDQIVSIAISLEYRGRQSELEALEKFLKSSDKRVLPVHGPGGVGKTRFALQASIFANEQEDWDVYWANVQTMSLSSKWFQTIIPSRKTLLVIDEPEDANTIKSLLEQISLSKMSNWKVLIVTRSPKDPVLHVLRNPRSKILETELVLEPLAGNDIELLAYNLLLKCEKLKDKKEDDLRSWAKIIGKISNGFPIWATVAIFLMEKEKSINELPNDEYGLATLYVEEIIKHIPTELNGEKLAFREFLQLLALFQPINVETDKELLDFIAQEINLRREEYIHDLFSNLIDRKVCKKRGRLIEIKPDVIRDHVLYDWLGKKHNAEALVKSILDTEKFPQFEKALQQLGRLELSYKLKNEDFSVLEPVVSYLKKIAKTGNLLDQHSVLKVASEFCFSRPLALIEISQILRTNFKPNEKIKYPLLGEMELSHIDLVLNLPWEIFIIGRYSLNNEEQEKVFMELIELAKYEYDNINSEKEYLKNDGKRAPVLLQRLLPGGKEQFRPFDKIAYSWLEKKLEEFNTIGEAELHILEGLAKIMLSIDREDIYSEGMKVVITRYLISPNSITGTMRQNLRIKLWKIVEDIKMVSNKRKIVWKLLEESHRQANMACDPPGDRETNPSHVKYWENELKDDLERVKKIMQEKKAHLAEISELREIWDWHLQFDKRDIIKKLADECEEIMNSNNEFSNFRQLYIYDDFQKKSEISKKIALDLDSKEKIFEFVSKAYDFAGKENYLHGVLDVADFLGQDFLAKDYIRQYVDEVFNNEHSPLMHVYTASGIFALEIKRVRENESNNLFEKFFEYYSIIKNEEAKQVFLKLLYYRPHPEARGLLIDKDMDILSRIVRTKCYPDMAIDTLFFVLGYMFYINFDEDKRIIESLWSGIKSNDAANYYSWLVEGIWYRTIFSDREEFAFEFPGGFYKWLIGQLNQVPDLDEIGGLFRDKLLWIQKKTGEELDVCWFYSFLQERVDKIEKNILKEGKIISSHNEIINCVKKIKDANEVTETILTSFRKLLEFYNHKSALRYFLPEILTNLDPDGIILPDLIVEKLRECEFQLQEDLTESECFKLIRYAAYYQINSASWRAIAIEASKLVQELDRDKRKRIYSALLTKHFSSWAGIEDEISAYYLNAVKRAQKDMDDEDEEILKDLMRYRLQIAETDLKNDQQRKEEMEF